ncbi:MAG: ribosome biogenesis GTP-binding protein YsxC [Polyangiaceae bacterium]|nr:ribosome biogenesis GTP-binding protein YsxC [Polyangiaceae bacterium]
MSTPLSPLRVVDADFFAAAGPGGELPAPTLPEIAFAGRSNVGKSSLMNALMGRRNLVRTSGTPGCTRAVNLFRARCADDVELLLADLPGYGYAKRSKDERTSWGPLLERYLGRRPSLAALVVLVDARRGIEDEERQLLEFVASTKAQRAPVATLIVATKLDKVPASRRKVELQRIRAEGAPVLGVSAESGDGVAAVWSRVRAVVGVGLPQ